MPKRFSPEFKQQAVSYALANSDQSIAALAKHLGIGESTLDRWVRQQHGDKIYAVRLHVSSR